VTREQLEHLVRAAAHIADAAVLIERTEPAPLDSFDRACRDTGRAKSPPARPLLW
jgi:hypothetical protein